MPLPPSRRAEPAPVVSGTGWQLVRGDALPYLKSLPDGFCQAVVCDPPFSDRTHAGHDSVAGRIAGDEGYDGANRKSLGYGSWTDADVQKFIPELCRVCSGWVVVMTDHTLAPVIMRAMERAGRYVFAPLPWYSPGSRVRLSGDGPSSWTDWIIVGRTAAQHRWGTLPGGYSPDGRPGWRDKERMGGKPTRLMRELVRDYSKPGDTVLDPFCGMGTTGLACLVEGRKSVQVEIDPDCCDRVARRMSETEELVRRGIRPKWA